MSDLTENNVERNGSQTDMRLGGRGLCRKDAINARSRYIEQLWTTLIDCATSHQGENVHSWWYLEGRAMLVPMPVLA